VGNPYTDENDVQASAPSGFDNLEMLSPNQLFEIAALFDYVPGFNDEQGLGQSGSSEMYGWH
jgi:hypothetical protein